MESFINEIYISAAEANASTMFGHDLALGERIADIWRGSSSDSRWSLERKYADAVQATGQPAYTTGQLEHQDAVDLIHLRNTLVHYKPEWDDDLRRHAEIERRLAGRFAESRLSEPSQAFFPHRCLGAGCASWAAEAALGFVTDVQSKLGLPHRFSLEQVLLRPQSQ